MEIPTQSCCPRLPRVLQETIACIAHPLGECYGRAKRALVNRNPQELVCSYSTGVFLGSATLYGLGNALLLSALKENPSLFNQIALALGLLLGWIPAGLIVGITLFFLAYAFNPGAELFD